MRRCVLERTRLASFRIRGGQRTHAMSGSKCEAPVNNAGAFTQQVMRYSEGIDKRMERPLNGNRGLAITS